MSTLLSAAATATPFVGIVLVAFATIFPVELPDKTFVATLVLATRFRPMHVWIGVCAAFLVQTVIAVTVGGLLANLPRTPVAIASALLFAIGGAVLWHGAAAAGAEAAEAEEEFSEKAAEAAQSAPTSGWRAISASFLVLFLAEFGDLSQLLTANLVVQHENPLAVGVGAFTALALVSGLGAATGRQLLRRISLTTIRRIGGTVCLLLAAWTVYGLVTGNVG